MKQKVIETLKRSRQNLVFLDAHSTPVRELVGDSERDQEMRRLLLDLKADGVISGFTGFWCNNSPGYVSYTHCTLTDEFYRRYCRAGKQLSLF